MLNETIKNLNPKVIFEVGVGNPSIARSIPFMNRLPVPPYIFMFEPNPRTYKWLVDSFGAAQNLVIHNVALFDKEGEIEFADDGDSSYITEVVSPTIHNAPDYANSRPKMKVKCSSIKKYDNGNIDVILIDTEGSEWRILKEMISRPKLIVLETHSETSYRTPNLDLIEKWMEENSYALIRKEVTDSWYMKK